jgi:DNA-binding response OmpR family regulator
VLNGNPLHGLPYLEGYEDLRIAVLDDNPDIGEMLQIGLELYGHTVASYFNPSTFLSTLMEPTSASTPFDLLIIDLFLSEGISGVEVVQQVWNAFPDLPVILISACSSWQIEPARRALPGVRVLRKPFSLATLLAMVKELLGAG